MLGGVRGRRLVTASYSIVSFWEKAWRVKSASCFLWLLPIDGCGKARYDETRPKAPGEPDLPFPLPLYFPAVPPKFPEEIIDFFLEVYYD